MQELKVPAGGTPPVIETSAAFKESIAAIGGGSGPIAIDAERASGFRYSARAYLIQINRRGSGIHLIDPIALQDDPQIADLNRVIQSDESIIHASTQDLPCLREFGIFPTRLFDTELGARIAGCERVGLSSLCENLLGIALAKEHSAVDWSIRPLRNEWLDYAALDVEVLLDLRNAVYQLLEEGGKREYAQQDFDAIIAAPPARVIREQWRRTSGMHLLNSRLELAIIRELWMQRDRIAQELDIAPGRLLSDSILAEIAKRQPKTREDFISLPAIAQRVNRPDLKNRIDLWFELAKRAYLIPEQEWPPMRAQGENLPPPRIWAKKFPLAFAHLSHARHQLSVISSEMKIPLENLITPEIVRRIAFDDGRERTIVPSREGEIELARVRRQLTERGARQWQVDLAAPILLYALTQSKPMPTPEPEVVGEGS